MINIFIDTTQAKKELTQLGFFICHSGTAGTGRRVIARKTSKNDFIEVANIDKFIDKVESMTLLPNKNIDVLETVDLQAFVDFDNRSNEIKQRQELVRSLKPKKFLNVKKAIIAKDYHQNYYVIDVKAKEASPIGESLINPDDVSNYSKATILTALKETGVNKFEPNKNRQEKIFKSIGIFKK